MAGLTGKIAIVTGSSRGIGRAIAERLARDGALVIVNYTRNVNAAREVVAAIDQAGGRARLVQADVRRAEEVLRLFDEAQRLGGVDIVVANAGVTMARPFIETRDEDYEQMFEVNARGTFLVLREAARRLRDGGRVVTISTADTALALAGTSVYSASKAAAEELTKVLSKELGGRGITVNVVSPGVTETEMLDATPQFRQLGVQRSPLGRLGTPADIADVVGFVVSDEARWLTGQNVQASGGIA
jgi:3-oxoacyl-[acyl-carrier protein] reductase